MKWQLATITVSFFLFTLTASSVWKTRDCVDILYLLHNMEAIGFPCVPVRVAIIGGGIAGLATSIALRCLDHPTLHFDVQIYEKAPRLAEIGASIALGPNGLRTLEKLGVTNALDDDIAIRNKSTGSPMIYR